MVETKQSWVKHGQIYTTRAQCPTVLKIIDDGRDVWRVFFADRDALNRTFIRYIDVNPDNPAEILYEERGSLLPHGLPGTFDYYGVMPTSVITRQINNRTIYNLFYIGWGQRLDVPYHNGIGVATSSDGKNFVKEYTGPIIGTSSADPYFTGTACVSPIAGSPGYECYYLSCSGWARDADGKLEPMYRIKRATTHGGVDSWHSERVIIDYKDSREGGICNATLYNSPEGIKHMWYCYRNTFDYRDNPQNSYRIGYARGEWQAATTWEGGKWGWQRQDHLVDLPLGADGSWDSTMLCYPNVIEHKDKLYMFYNGNGFGTTGFGFATLNLTSR